MRQFYVYILASHSRALYVGVTNDLTRRVFEHKAGATDGFTSQYRVTMLVYYETTTDFSTAVSREKQIKRWTRRRKYRLFEKANPDWRDLSIDWFDDATLPVK